MNFNFKKCLVKIWKHTKKTPLILVTLTCLGLNLVLKTFIVSIFRTLGAVKSNTLSFFLTFSTLKEKHCSASYEICAASSSSSAPVTRDEVRRVSDSVHQSGTARYALGTLLTRCIFLHICPCPSVKKGGQWNTLPHWQGFRHRLRVHSIAALFPCHEVEQLSLLLRTDGKTWAYLHVKSHYLSCALGR